MSNASAWARKGRRVMRFRERLTAYQRRRRLIPLTAVVDFHGDLLIEDSQRLSPSEALRLARWILDTFGETP